MNQILTTNDIINSTLPIILEACTMTSASESLPNEQLLLNEKLLSCEQIYTNGKKVRAASTSRIFDVHTY